MASTPKVGGVKAKIRGSPLLGGHRGKEPNKFQFDIFIERVIGGSSGSTAYSIKWCRGVKTASTKQFNAKPKDEEGVELGQKLSLLCTLYRTKALDTIEFEPKDSKICLVSHKDGKKSDKTVGKIHFDLSKFAGIPSATTPHVFELNAKTKVVVSITCTFVRVSRGTASSCGSGMSGMTVSSGEYDVGGNDDFADLDELAVPTDKEVNALLSPVSEATWSPAAAAPMEASASPAVSPTRNTKTRDEEATTRTESSRTENVDTGKHKTTRTLSFAKIRTMSTAGKEGASGSGSRDKGRHNEGRAGKAAKDPRSSGLGSTFRGKAKIGNLEGEIEKLKQELDETKKEAEKSRVLHQMSEDIIRELREKIEYSNGSTTSSDATRMKELQEKVDNLEKAIATATIDNRQLGQTYDSRISTLKNQIESLERSKTRLEGENKTFRSQLAHGQSASKSNETTSNEARGKLLGELTTLRGENETLEAKLREKEKSIASLQERQRESSAEAERLDSKLIAHEEHSEQVKSTFEELTKMYNDLTADHTQLQILYSQALNENTNVAPSPRTPKSTVGRSRTSSFSLDKTKLKRKKNKGEDIGSGKEASGENDDEGRKEKDDKGDGSKDEEIHRLRSELQKKRMALVDAEREKLETQKQTAGLESDLHQARLKLQQARKEVTNLTERLEASRARELNSSEQLDAAHTAKIDYQAELEASKKQHRADMLRLRGEKAEEIKKLRLELVGAVSASSSGDSSTQVKKLEEALKEATQREDEYEKEILKLTQIMDGLANKLTEATRASEEDAMSKTPSDASTRSVDAPGTSVMAKSSRNVLSQSQMSKRGSEDSVESDAGAKACCAKCSKPIEEEGAVLVKQQSKRPRGNALTSAFSFRLKPDPDNNSEGTGADTFISSSKIRQMDLFEKITDGRLLNLLVDTKMKLAVSEEEKLSLEHLIRRVRAGDRHIQQKLAEHASRLEVKLNQANLMLANLQDENDSSPSLLSASTPQTDGKRAALKQFNPDEVPTVSDEISGTKGTNGTVKDGKEEGTKRQDTRAEVGGEDSRRGEKSGEGTDSDSNGDSASGSGEASGDGRGSEEDGTDSDEESD